MKKIIFLSSILLFLSMVSFTATGETLSEENDRQQFSREITSDSLMWEYEKGVAIFWGNVVMNGDEGKITSSKMTVFFDDEDEIEKMVVEGNTSLVREKQKGGGEIIEIYPSFDLLILKDRAWISSQKAVFNGEEIRFDTAKEIINITKGVKGEIQTGSNEKSMNGGTPARRTSSLAGGEAQSSKGTKEEENN